VTNASTSPSPAPMEGGGVYNRSSRVQAAGLSPAVPLLGRAAGVVSLSNAPEAIVIADYGSSEGRNSLAPMAIAIGALRERVGPNRAISVIHTDLPGNDFSALFETLANDPDSYLRGDPAVFASAVGRSLYQQILPSDSVALGWTSWTLHWLSRTPAQIPDHLLAAYSHDVTARAAYTRQATEDWRNFFLSRGAELRTGGRLVVLTLALTEDGRFPFPQVLEALYGALMGLVDEGFIGTEELRRMAMPICLRSRADLVKPFAETGRFAGLSMEHLEMFTGVDTNWLEFERDGDANKFGAGWAAFMRASVFPTLALSLDCGRDDPRVVAFVSQLETGMATRLAAAPQPMLIPLASMVLVKESS
jgi:SAM dependent carboxyl methyltransferase